MLWGLTRTDIETDTFNGGNSKDTLDASASTQTIVTDGGNGNGDDTLIGRKGDDVMLGSAGDDLLQGGSADDTLIGGDGNNTLFGGLGADTFVTGLGGVDIIQDFNAAEGDVIQI